MSDDPISGLLTGLGFDPLAMALALAFAIVGVAILACVLPEGER